jgi:GNAT superfamily N-acetyltransferase
MVTPLIFMLHDGRTLPQPCRDELTEVDYDEVRELRDIWHREDFGEHASTDAFHGQAREIAELSDVRVIAALKDGAPVAFAQVETHDGASEVAQVFVHPDRRGAGLGGALTSSAVQIAASAAPDVWICADRDDRPRELYERLGFHTVLEMGVAILLPKS